MILRSHNKGIYTVPRTPIRSHKASHVAIATLLLGLGVAACGSSNASANPDGTLHKGELIIAYRSDDKPASYISNNQPAGYAVELMKSIAAQMKLTPKFVDVAFDSILPGVQNHQYDTSIGVLAEPSRQKQVGFTTPSDYVFAQLISKKSAPIATIADAAGKTVAITAGSALIPLLEAKVPSVQVKEFPKIPASANALEIGQVQGLFTGPLTTKQLLSQYPSLTATQTIPIGFDALPYPKGNTTLGKALDSALATVMKDGTYTKEFKQFEPGKTLPSQLLDQYPGMPQA